MRIAQLRPQPLAMQISGARLGCRRQTGQVASETNAHRAPERAVELHFSARSPSNYASGLPARPPAETRPALGGSALASALAQVQPQPRPSYLFAPAATTAGVATLTTGSASISSGGNWRLQLWIHISAPLSLAAATSVCARPAVSVFVRACWPLAWLSLDRRRQLESNGSSQVSGRLSRESEQIRVA